MSSNAFRGIACSPTVCVGVGRKSADGGVGTGADVLVASSTDGGLSWTEHTAAVGLRGSLEEVVWTGARYACSLVLDPRPGVDLGPLFVGQGCCARHNPWRLDVRRRD